MKNLIYIPFLLFIFNCKKNHSRIENNVWYTSRFIEKEKYNFEIFDYREIYFNKKGKVYISDMFSSDIQEKRYEINIDSLFLKDIKNQLTNRFLVLPFSNKNHDSIRLIVKNDTLVLKKVIDNSKNLSLKNLVKELEKKQSNMNYDSIVRVYKDNFLKRGNTLNRIALEKIKNK